MKKSFGAQTLVYVTPVWVVGTYDYEGRPDATTVAWGGVCSSDPPALAISLRQSRYAYDNILNRQAFTVNVPSATQAAIADYCGIVSGRHTDKFAKANLTAEPAGKVDAPGIKEFPMIVECKLIGQMDVGIHTHFVGEILDVRVDDTALGPEGLPDILKVNPMIYAPENRDYHGVGAFVGKAFALGKDLK